MNTQIHTFDTTSPERETDLTEGLVPMEMCYQNEFLTKVPGLRDPLIEEEALRWILGEIRDKCHFLIAKSTDQSYIWYTAGKIQLSGFFESNATFVMPEFRRRGIWEELKAKQIEYAKWAWCSWFTTVINAVNTQAYEMMDKMWCELIPIPGENDEITWWRVFLNF